MHTYIQVRTIKENGAIGRKGNGDHGKDSTRDIGSRNAIDRFKTLVQQEVFSQRHKEPLRDGCDQLISDSGTLKSDKE